MYIRTRLALWFMLILAVVLAAFSYGLYQLLHSSLLDADARDVRERATALATTARPAAGSTALTLPPLDAFSSPDTYIEILDPQGTVLDHAGDLGDQTLPFDADAIAADTFKEIRLGKVPIYLYGRPVLQGTEILGYVLVARSPRSEYTALSSLSNFLYPGVGLALLFAGLAVWVLVRRAMRPLERLAGTASEIATTGDHTRRVNERGPPDEIGRLAASINSMLEALDAAYRQVQDVNDLQRHFLADVSHELRTPLTIMLSSLDLVTKIGPADPEFQARALADMRVETDRMARMVTQLLLLARTDSSTPMAQAPILLVDVLTDCCRQAHTNGSGVTLTDAGLDTLEGVVVWANADYLKQLFLILLDNAVKYTPAGGTVTVAGQAAADSVRVTVADTGIGIPAADLPHIFDRFYRAENTRDQAGTGLGLAIARRIAEQHGGQIAVHSTPGAGSQFTVTLPVLDPARLRSKTLAERSALAARAGVRRALAPAAPPR